MFVIYSVSESGPILSKLYSYDSVQQSDHSNETRARQNPLLELTSQIYKLLVLFNINLSLHHLLGKPIVYPDNV